MPSRAVHPPVGINPDEVEFTAIRAQGAGGQNVNKVSSAVHLRFDIAASSLPEGVKQRLLALRDQRLTADGVVVIKAQTSRSQDANRADALARLQALVDSVAVPPRVRRVTRPTYGSKQRRLEGKTLRGQVKAGRGKVTEVSGPAQSRRSASPTSAPNAAAPRPWAATVKARPCGRVAFAQLVRHLARRRQAVPRGPERLAVAPQRDAGARHAVRRHAFRAACASGG